MPSSAAEATEPVASELAQAKRFLEYLRADPARGTRALEDPGAIARALGLTIDPNEFRRLWDAAYATREPAERPTPLEREYAAYARSLVDLRERMREGGRARDPRVATWRERQIRRARLELGDAKNTQIVHAPFALELSRGCSVGCWFCGVSAPKLSDVFLRTRDNAALWRDVVRALSETLGDAARWGFCYWATDPLDNPDYERFCVDLHEITGGFPQTTTAIPLRDPARVRRILHLSERYQGPVNRFSVLTSKMLDRIHAEFTPDELARVELIPQNKESSLAYARSGRARDRPVPTPPEPEADASRGRGTGTIACVSGFLVNMVDRSIRLISPVQADDRWPDGYVVYEEDRFEDGASFRDAIERMIASRPESVRRLGRIRFNARLAYDRTARGFVLRSGALESRHEHDRASDWLGGLGDAIQAGRLDCDGIALAMALRFGVPEDQTERSLEQMFRNGLFDEEAS